MLALLVLTTKTTEASLKPLLACDPVTNAANQATTPFLLASPPLSLLERHASPARSSGATMLLDCRRTSLRTHATLGCGPPAQYPAAISEPQRTEGPEVISSVVVCNAGQRHRLYRSTASGGKAARKVH